MKPLKYLFFTIRTALCAADNRLLSSDLPERNEVADALVALNEMNEMALGPTPVNPDATARLVVALRAIVDADMEGRIELSRLLLNDANNTLHMAQLPVDYRAQAKDRIETFFKERSEPVIPPFPSSISDPSVAICNKSLADSVLTVLVNVAGVMDGEIPENIKQQVHSVIKAAIIGTGEPAERPVVPVSEDVEKLRHFVKSATDFIEQEIDLLAAIDRLAAAAQKGVS